MYASKHHPEYLQRIVIAVHPISTSDQLVSEIVGSESVQTDVPYGNYWKKFLGKSVEFVPLIDQSLHLRTAWATRSLVDASILMIREAQKVAGGSLWKFILVDKTTCPLYNLKVIYDSVTANRKNWFDSPLHNRCARLLAADNAYDPALKCDRHSPNACLRRTDCSFWSQWWVIDTRYYSEIFEANIEKVDDGGTFCGASDKVIDIVDAKGSSDPANDAISAALSAFTDGVNRKPCVASDELFFQMFLKRKYPDQDMDGFLDSMNMIALDEFVTNEDDMPSALRVSQIPLRVMRVDPVLLVGKAKAVGAVGSAPIMQQHFGWGKRAVKLEAVHDEPGWETFEFVDSPEGAQEDYHEQWKQKYGKFPFYVNPIHILDKPVVTDVVPLCSTYTDWRFVNPNPFNIFRSFKHNGFVFVEKHADQTVNVTSYDPLYFVDSIMMGSPVWGDPKPATYESLSMSHIPHFSHPLEYNTNHLYAYISGYNLLEYFNESNAAFDTSDGMLQGLQSMYEDLLKPYISSGEVTKVSREYHFSVQSSEYEGSIFDVLERSIFLIYGGLSVQKPKDKSIFYTFYVPVKSEMTYRLGIPVSADVLNQARMRGALFLRKCEAGSYIHAYSQQLFSASKYLYADIL